MDVDKAMCASASFCDWEVLLHQSTVKPECTPERLQGKKKEEKVFEEKKIFRKQKENTVPAERGLRKIRNDKKEKNKIKTEEQREKR